MGTITYLAVNSGHQTGQGLIVGLDTTSRQHLLDVISSGGGVATDQEHKVSCDVLHIGCRKMSVRPGGGWKAEMRATETHLYFRSLGHSCSWHTHMMENWTVTI